MVGEASKNWNFHHIGVIVDDMEKAVAHYKSLGAFEITGPHSIDWPKEVEIDGTLHALGPQKMMEYSAYGEFVIKEGKLVVPIDTKEPDKHAPNTWFQAGSITYELIRPSTLVAGYHIDTLRNRGEGINHVAYYIDPEHYDDEIERMKAKQLDIIETGLIRADVANSDRKVCYEYTYFDTRKSGGFAIELMRPPALR